jgi:hypothetical protein
MPPGWLAPSREAGMAGGSGCGSAASRDSTELRCGGPGRRGGEGKGGAGEGGRGRGRRAWGPWAAPGINGEREYLRGKLSARQFGCVWRGGGAVEREDQVVRGLARLRRGTETVHQPPVKPDLAVSGVRRGRAAGQPWTHTSSRPPSVLRSALWHLYLRCHAASHILLGAADLPRFAAGPPQSARRFDNGVCPPDC